MKLCGIELKSNNVILVVLDDNKYCDLKIKKLILEDDEKQGDIRQFCNDFLLFLEQNQIDKVVIKKRAKKGNFAGGAVTFKLEGLIQLNPMCEVELISPQAISSFEKKNMIDFPNELKKYQEQAYLTALCSN
ncbi:hypothetical protein GCM10012288_16590 [Malaciobacter pacificus]|uniref:DUF3010 domain-containing protein n=1 Tax=Malaciobacter pacificus TaxID=1080223 RepID=A0A5C2H757_9BACT|nr:DUF3010 family protein [Malaciobacter pacificus]QEP34159.1 DUF3010 domain-containing protein [Malaciobacter pacificus]GGD42964.1 hypothetical protein GCM10012288_16590 [Malaciobacter pacificus]